MRARRPDFCPCQPRLSVQQAEPSTMSSEILSDRYARQVRFAGIGPEGQARLGQSTAVLVGCGALGTHSANTLVRAGVGHVILVDRDTIEASNLQRQSLFDEDDLALGIPKAQAAANKLRRVNSEVRVTAVVMDLHGGNIEGVLAGADVVVDGSDNFDTRYLLNDACVKLGLSWVYAGVLSTHGMSLTIVPGQTPCFRCVFPEPPPPGTSPTCETAGILEPIVAILSALQCTEAIKILAGARDTLRKELVHVDVWDNRFVSIDVGPRVEECPACGQARFDFLRARSGLLTTSLCGRDSVQVSPATPVPIDLPSLAERLRGVGDVSLNRFILRLRIPEYEISVFPDGRSIVKGTTDEACAKTIHAKYVGA